MSDQAAAAADETAGLLALYDAAVVEVYRYLLRRCDSASTAEDLTSETFLAAVDAVRNHRGPSLTTAWLIGVARNKLVDHWRRLERQQRLLGVIDGTATDGNDNWDSPLDALLVRDVLVTLAPQYRAALSLRYLDTLPVAEVARHLLRTVGATEVLLVRAKQAFRSNYEALHGRTEDNS